MTNAKRTNPELWEEVKDQLMESDKGGEPGQWSARKAQLSVQEYKRRGGGYDSDGPDQEYADLAQWTREKWGTRSGEDSSERGERYLPRLVRMLLTEAEYRRSSIKKRADSHEGDDQFSDQPDDVRDKAAKIRNSGPTKEILLERARDLDIKGRSSMKKETLLEAIDDATDEHGRDARPQRQLQRKSKAELYECARDSGIDGRSRMTKEELVAALAER